MKVSDAITVSQKNRILGEIVEKLRLLCQNPHLKELLTEIKLFHREEKERREGGIFQKTVFSSVQETLILNHLGIGLKTVSREGYTKKGNYEPMLDLFPYKSGGEKETKIRIVGEGEFPMIAENFNLDSDELQKLIERIEQ